MITINLFGPTSVVTESGDVLSSADLGGIKPRQILELLAVSVGTPMAKDRLADLLWDGHPPKTYVATLESYVCVLRRSLGLTQGRRSLLATTSRGYLLDPAGVRVDLELARRLLSETATASPEVCVELAEQALTMTRGVLLASEPYAGWATGERDYLDQDLVAACGRAAEHATRLGMLDRAVRLANAATERDPLAEAPVRQLMRALWLSGQRFEALRVYAALRKAMLDELGTEPGRATHDLYLEILRDDAVATAGEHAGGHSELRLLLGLLRQTLESMPGVQLPGSDSALAAVAVRTLEVA
jgi:DNA-binding SARP family transcriptional activator